MAVVVHPSAPGLPSGVPTGGGGLLIAQSACGHVAASEPVKPTGPAGSASESETTGRGGKPESVSSLRSRLLRTSPWGSSAAARLKGRALSSAHLDAGNPRGSAELAGMRTFNGDSSADSDARRSEPDECEVGVPAKRHIEVGRPVMTGRNLGNPCAPLLAGSRCNSGVSSPSLGSGSLSTRPTAVPGSSLPEFRALLFVLAFPVAVVAFVAAVIFIFLPSEPEKNFGSDGVSVSIRTAREHTE